MQSAAIEFLTQKLSQGVVELLSTEFSQALQSFFEL
jgi:hypothetical protein